MIKIISGVYGHRKEYADSKDKKSMMSIACKTSKDGEFSLPAKEEQRLVDRGVAVYVTVGQKSEVRTGDKKPEYNAAMSLDELKALLTAAGLPVKPRMTKADIIAVLNKHYNNEGLGVRNEECADAGGEDGPPLVSVGEPVT